VRTAILKETQTFIIFPEKFQEEPYLKDEPGNYRSKVIWSYKIIYEVTPKAILILDIYHTSRDPSNIKLTKK
jgi:plasmid stabilization system protein ParE